MCKGNNDGMVLHEVINLLCADHENRRRAHKRIPLVTLIDMEGKYLGYYCGLRPLDMANMLLILWEQSIRCISVTHRGTL